MLNRNDDQNETKKMVLFCVAAASMVLLLFLVVLYNHESKSKNRQKIAAVEDVESETSADKPEDEEVDVGKSNLVSQDLDFWDMYDDRKPVTTVDDSEHSERNNSESSYKEREAKYNAEDSSSSSSSETEKKDEPESMNGRKDDDKEDMDDGKHIKVSGSDGKPQWIQINDDIGRNKYDFANCLVSDNGLLSYKSQEIKSYDGIDISNYQGNIDFNKVKNAGIDFVMIKIAARGYETGQVTIDDKFVEYSNGATTSGIPIGGYIISNAITDVEAVEEANFAVAAAANYNVKYPLAIDFTEVTNDKSRTEKLTSAERTAIVKTFCDTVKSYGRTPAISASRDFLLTKLNLLDLKEYDIWLKDEAVVPDYMKMQHIDDNSSSGSGSSNSSSSSSSSSLSNSSSSSSSSGRTSSSGTPGNDRNDRPSQDNSNSSISADYIGTDYPYNFPLWQYSKKGTINGIDGNVNLNISFVNYAER